VHFEDSWPDSESAPIAAPSFSQGARLGPLSGIRTKRLMGRIWELRRNFTAYDAAYISLAEATNSVLYTCDEKLRKGHRAQVALFTN
jgi:predicted nucleic acid-binding protein